MNENILIDVLPSLGGAPGEVLSGAYNPDDE
ncbi:hypothetical protein A5825_002689 [Enterococcus gallinarum]|nr:hypothetical protein A5825_002689 [Enterococcus gallinarum]